jgi:hypothetical protein
MTAFRYDHERATPSGALERPAEAGHEDDRATGRPIVALANAAITVARTVARTLGAADRAPVMSRGERVTSRALLVLLLFLLAGQVFAEARTFELTVQAGELPPEVRVIRVRQGDDVTLRWTTDRSLTIHLHGYDIEKQVPVGAEPTIMHYTARATGRFPIEVHGRGHAHERTLVYLEVYPR